MNKRRVSLGFDLWWPDWPAVWQFAKRYLLPTSGNVIFILLVIGILFFAQSVGAFPSRSPQQQASTSTGTVAYQGRLADTGGAPLTGTYNMIFRLYDAVSGGTPLWEEQWTGSNGAKVSDGLFNVMLGSLTPIPQSVITGNDTLYLGVTVGTDDEMSPRVQLGSVPFAVQALTVPDGSITGAKIATGVVTTTHLTDGAVTNSKIASSVFDNISVEQAKVIANVQSVQGNAEMSVGTNGYADLLNVSVTAPASVTLRISYHSLVWKTDAPGRTTIGVRIDGNPNTFPAPSSQVFVGTPVSSYWVHDSLYLASTYFIDVPAGSHTVTLVLSSGDNGTSHARHYGMSVEMLQQP